ncbi:NFACT RNA binding domain-containing protein [Peptococcaceae bacterium 1198_IL3148]
MPYDGLVMAAVGSELKDKLIGARIEKIYQPLREELAITVSKPKERYKILISANATNARIHTTASSKPNPATPPLFCMVLRKHLEGGRILAVSQPGLERVLHLTIDTRDELGRSAPKTLVVEVMGKHSNIILIDNQSNCIIDGIKRYSHAISRHREVLPGREYVAPPEQQKHSPLGLTEERFFALITQAELDAKLTDILLSTFDGFSPRMCRELVYRCDLPLDLTLNHCGEYELRLLWQHFSTIGRALDKEEFAPSLVFNRDGTPKDFAAFELTQFKNEKIVHGDMNLLLDTFYTHRDYQQQLQAKKQSLLTILNRDLSRLKNKLPKYQKSLNEADRGEDYRLYGDLITAHMYQLTKGLSQVELVNYYDPEQKSITVPLDKQKTPAQNAQAYFKKYVKAKSTLEAVTEQLQQAKEELNYLESVDTTIRQATTLEDLEEIKLEMAAQGYLKLEEKKGGKKDKKRDKPQPLPFTSSDGFTILVGKNNRQNDYLTMRYAKENDLWLHTKDIPGSHVIIRTEGKPVPNQTLEEAAILAAFHSKAKQSKQVPVDYTYVKHVHKPNGAKPGMVIYENQQTVFVTPDEGVVARLTTSDH